MLELLPLPFAHIVGVRVSGKVNHTDIEIILAEVERKLASEAYLGVLIELEHFDGFTIRGLVKEFKFLSKYINRLTRTAIVGEPRWFNRGTELIKRVYPNIEIEHFIPLQKDEALLWVSERDAGTFG
ncbi:MAG: STAS/SEC14 domain-containing protein [Zhongshania sp.]|uniref:STAS/SEC14 domain-containing protein n=1 Tax=Zhongshania sp. TaxID=1971902 RepID=UPI0026344290|nr:STAS/SEC14 domain-containing protein [Zhongshania sp.]MDF1692483.1 STAS/SEC14 domain-containing protein [Zhongshania sp.]